MSEYVWCKRDERRIPSFKCLLCREHCYTSLEKETGSNNALEILVKSGRYKECFIMKRKENPVPTENLSHEATGEKATGENKMDLPAGKMGAGSNERIYVMEDGRLQPFASEDYTVSTLYQVVESFSVECKLVRPEDPSNVVYEGKKPSKKTLPVVVTKKGESLIMESWESLESKPEQLTEAIEVIGVMPVKKIFVLRKNIQKF